MIGMVMTELSSKERLIRTLKGEPIDRIATFDIIHNIDLIEYLTDDKVTATNAEDLLCKSASKVLDLIRHFAVPADLNDRTFTDENGFTYQYEWWTGHVVNRPEFDSTKQIENCVKKDIEIIYDCIEKKKVCHIARQHVMLFDESFETVEQVRSEFKRITEKLNGTMMMAPEDVNALGVAVERYDEANWWYFYYDYPKTATEYMDALTNYSLYFIDNFACADVSPFAQISVATGSTTGLLYSAELMRKEVVTREKKKIQRWKEHGYYIMTFLDGYKWPLIDDFLDAGADEIHPCESYCQMDVATLRQKYPELALSQPIDCTQLLSYGTEDEIRQEVIKAIKDAGERKIIIGSTSEIHPEVNIKNALAMYETAINYKL